MKRQMSIIYRAVLLSVLFLGLLPITAYAASPSDIIIGNSFTLSSGDTLQDDLLIIGGNVTLLDGSVVNGNILLFGGRLDAAGKVNGDLVVLGGTVKLDKTFSLNGNLSTAGTSITRDRGAQINGEVYTQRNAPQIFTLLNGVRLNNFTTNHPLLGVAGFFLRLFLWALVAMIVAMFIPSQLARTSQTAFFAPLVSGGLGLLTAIVGPIVIVLLAITICLIPIAILAVFLLGIAWAFGLIAMGLELGKRINNLFKGEWHPAISAGVGTLVLIFVINGLETIIPCIGWIPKVLVGLVGLGAVLLTQFGMKPYSLRPALPGETNPSTLPPEP